MNVLVRMNDMNDFSCPQARPMDEFLDDFETQEKVFKDEVALAKERNAERKVSPRSVLKYMLHAITLDVACLLYTSPSPRDKRQSRMPSSA